MKFDEFIIILTIKNLKNISKFYQDVLGLELYKNEGLCKIFNIIKGSKIGFYSYIPVIHNNNCPILTFIIKNVEKI